MARHTTANVTATRKASGGARSTQARPAGEIVTATLAGHPDRTAAELAQLAGLGTSTVTKALAALETAGRARRHTPEATGDGGWHLAVRWQPVPATASADAEPPATQRHRPTTKTASPKTPTPTTQATAAQPTDSRSEPEATAGTAAAKARTDADSALARTGRLGKGELGTLVLEYLLAHPGDLGPTAIGKALTRSQGAVANCMTKLATSGDIVQTSDKPRRYRLASCREA